MKFTPNFQYSNLKPMFLVMLLFMAQFAFSQSSIFSEDFEGESHLFKIVNGDQTNKWVVGANANANQSSSTKSAYISNDGSSYNYTINSTSVVHLYTDITLPENQDEYELKFDWKGYGEGCCDYLKVFLLDTSYTPAAGSNVPNATLGSFNLSSDWKQAQVYFQIPMSSSKTVKRLVFSWRNDNSVGTQLPIAIDNISIGYPEPKYAIAKSGNEFTITSGTGDIAKATIQRAIDYIKTQAGSEDISIKFGDGADELDIGAESISFSNSNGSWGKITLSGKITSENTNNGTININSGVTVESAADIGTTINRAIYNSGTLTISGGKVLANAGYAIYNSSGTVNISGGEISATNTNDNESYAVYNYNGTVNISGGIIFSDYYAVYNGSVNSAVTITGGTISSTHYAVYISSGSLNLGGDPSITGSIGIPSADSLTLIADGANAFAPESNQYTLELNSYSVGMIVVYNGADFANNFTLANGDYLEKKEGNLVIATAGYKHEYSDGKYIITKETGLNATIESIINQIKTQAEGNAVSIQFGNSADELNIGTASISFESGWGEITLLGKLTSSANDYAISIAGEVSVNSEADIVKTTNNNNSNINYAIISNFGSLTINGGTISAIGNIYAVRNYNGTVNVNGGTVSSTNGYAIYGYSGGTLNITGGTVLSTNSYAIYNSYNVTLNVTGGTVSSTNSHAIYNSNLGAINITGGEISAAGTSYAIYNNHVGSNSIVLGGNPNITGKIRTATGTLSVVIEGIEDFEDFDPFDPSEGKYILDIDLNASSSMIVVENGAEYASNFELAENPNSEIESSLVPNGNNLVLTISNGYAVSVSETIYTITKGTGNLASVQFAIEDIKSQANGASTYIEFGDGTGELHIGSEGIEFNATNGGWGKITLSGKITSTNTNYTINVNSGISVESIADIINTNGRAIFINYYGELNITGGIISSATNYAIYNSEGTLNITGGTISSANSRAIHNNGTLNVSGGEVSATGSFDPAIYNYNNGKINISGTAVISSANTNENSGTIYMFSSSDTIAVRLEITGGEIKNNVASDNAIYNNSNYSIALSGNPIITGKIRTEAEKLSVTALGSEVYTLDPLKYSDGLIAVKNGADFISNFNVSNSNWSLIESENNLVLVDETSPVIARSFNKSEFKAFVQGGVLQMSGLIVGKQWSVYNLNGVLAHSGVAKSTNETLRLNANGVYFVKFNGQSLKVIIGR